MELFLICPQKNETQPDTYVERYDNPSPTPYIFKINQIGEVIVRFNDTMVVPLTGEDLRVKTTDRNSDEGLASGYSESRKLTRSYNPDFFNHERTMIGVQVENFANYSLVNNGTLWLRG